MSATAGVPAPPADEWRCFHCDERFNDTVSAAKHFGTHEYHQPACLIDVEQVRAQEAELARYREEDSEKDRAMARLRSGFAAELRREEERGYARGLADARKHPKEAATATPHPVPRGMLAWAIGQWFDQVAHRPLVNIYRQTLDHVWRSVIRHCEADDVVLCGPRHQDLIAALPRVDGVQVCWCLECRPNTLDDMRFVVCPDCGNKRCPRASNHMNDCTGSNEPGQQGSEQAGGVPPAQQPLDEQANNAGVATGSRNCSPSESVTRGSLPPPDSVSGRVHLLWCLHLQGPDDVFAAPSKAHAEKAAAGVNAADNSGLVKAVAAPWPHSAESHAEDVGEFIVQWLVPRSHVAAADDVALPPAAKLYEGPKPLAPDPLAPDERGAV